MKHRRKYMVIILCVCVCLSVCLQISGKTTNIGSSNKLLADLKLYKDNNRLLLKPFSYKVMTIYITHGYYFQALEDSWGHLHTSKLNCYCIMTITSKALHQIKHNWLKPRALYRSKHSSYFLAPPISTHVLCMWFAHM